MPENVSAALGHLPGCNGYTLLLLLFFLLPQIIRVTLSGVRDIIIALRVRGDKLSVEMTISNEADTPKRVEKDKPMAEPFNAIGSALSAFLSQTPRAPP